MGSVETAMLSVTRRIVFLVDKSAFYKLFKFTMNKKQPDCRIIIIIISCIKILKTTSLRQLYTLSTSSSIVLFINSLSVSGSQAGSLVS